jgi:hypothetical protein
MASDTGSGMSFARTNAGVAQLLWLAGGCSSTNQAAASFAPAYAAFLAALLPCPLHMLQVNCTAGLALTCLHANI